MTDKLIWQPSFENGKNVSIALDPEFALKKLNERPSQEVLNKFNEMASKAMIQYLTGRKTSLATKPFEFYQLNGVSTGLVTRINTEMVSGIGTSVNQSSYVNIEADVDGLERLREGSAEAENLVYKSRGTEHPIQVHLLTRTFDYWIKRSQLL